MEVSFNGVFVWLASTVVFVIGVRIYLQAVEIAAELSGGMSGKLRNRMMFLSYRTSKKERFVTITFSQKKDIA